MCFNLTRIQKICTKENQIPDSVLKDILCVYKFGKKGNIKDLPNNLICLQNGDFWTTWERVIKIRSVLEELKDGSKFKIDTPRKNSTQYAKERQLDFCI